MARARPTTGLYESGCGQRADLVDTKKVLDTALDPYQFTRDAYLARRRSQVYDGKPPAEKDRIVAPPKQEGPPAKP